MRVCVQAAARRAVAAPPPSQSLPSPPAAPFRPSSAFSPAALLHTNACDAAAAYQYVPIVVLRNRPGHGGQSDISHLARSERQAHPSRGQTC